MDPTKKKRLETLLYSTIGIGATALVIIAFNLIASVARQRIDLTAEKAYTLSPGTKAILAKLDTPIQVRFYCTKNANTMPVFLTTYAQRVEDLPDESDGGANGSAWTATVGVSQRADAGLQRQAGRDHGRQNPR